MMAIFIEYRGQIKTVIRNMQRTSNYRGHIKYRGVGRRMGPLLACLYSLALTTVSASRVEYTRLKPDLKVLQELHTSEWDSE
jgi:hypothetical protein